MSRCNELRPILVRVAEREADPEGALAVARHLTDCTACRILLARELRLEQALDALDDPVPVNEGFLQEVMQALPSTPPSAARKRVRFTLLSGTGCLLIGALSAAAARTTWATDPRALGLPSIDVLPLERFLEFAGAAALWFRVAVEGMGGMRAFELPSLRALLPEVGVVAGALGVALVSASALLVAFTTGRLRPSRPPG